MKKVNYIVKYGLSTGEFTEKLIKRRDSKTIIFYYKQNYKKGDLLIVYGLVVNIEQYYVYTLCYFLSSVCKLKKKTRYKCLTCLCP